MEKLYKSNKDKVISGVIGGIAEEIKMDSTILRILVVLVALFTAVFPVLIAYLVCALLIPERPFDLSGDGVEVVNENGETIRTSNPQNSNTRLYIGIAIISIGVLKLVHNFAWWINNDTLFGAAIVIAGVLVLVSAINKKKTD